MWKERWLRLGSDDGKVEVGAEIEEVKARAIN